MQSHRGVIPEDNMYCDRVASAPRGPGPPLIVGWNQLSRSSKTRRSAYEYSPENTERAKDETDGQTDTAYAAFPQYAS